MAAATAAKPKKGSKKGADNPKRNPPGEVSANVARSSQSENPPGEVADSGARSSQSENPQGEVPGQAKEEKPKAEKSHSRLRRRHQKSKGPILSLV